MSHNEKSLFWICVILTMAMAFTALMISLPRTVDSENPISLDYQGAIVTIFSILVTILVGWQIYNAISMDKRIRRLETRINVTVHRLTRANERIDSVTNYSEQFSLGACDLIFAMIREQSIAAEQNLTLHDILVCRCDAYVMAARSVVAVLNTQRTEPIYGAFIGLATGTMRRNAVRLFNNEFREETGLAFTNDDHNLCDELFDAVRNNASLLNEDNFNRIMDCHTLRRSFAPQS